MIDAVRVQVMPYDPRWPSDFDDVRQDLLKILAQVAVEAVEHVGSTSVRTGGEAHP